MSKMINVLVVNDKGIQFKEIKNDLHTYYEEIGCDLIDIRPIAKKMIIIIDDEGRLTEKKTNPILFPLMVATIGNGIAGNFIIASSDDEGETLSLTEVDVKFLKQMLAQDELPQNKGMILHMVEMENNYYQNDPEALKVKIYPMDLEGFKND